MELKQWCKKLDRDAETDGSMYEDAFSHFLNIKERISAESVHKLELKYNNN